jgi:predicted NAD/FAD-dependent oxidoreductase
VQDLLLIGAERRGLVAAAAAAAFLAKEGLSVTVYEKRQTIEGRSNEKNSRANIQL